MAFTDDFTGAPGQYLEDRTGWTREDGAAGACQINASNQLKIVSTTETAYTHDAGTADHYAQALVSYSSEIDMRFFPVCVRVADSNNFYGFRPYQDRKEIYKRVGGTFTLKAQLPGGGGGVTWRLSCSGNSFALLGNGVDQGMGFTDADLNTNTKAGIVARGDTLDPVLDNWESTEAAGGGTTVTATGVSGTGDIGTVTATGGALVAPTGVSATGQIGTVTVAIPATLPRGGLALLGAGA